MKAAMYHTFGGPEVLKIEEVTKPSPKENEVLVEVFASTVNSGDVHMRSGEPFIARLFAGPFTPKIKILGTTFSGRVAQVGSGVTKFSVGDEVYGSFGVTSGTHAEYLTIDQNQTIAMKPDHLSHEEAAALVFGPITAIYFLNKAKIKEKSKVLVIGGAGGVGSYAIQYAKLKGAQVSAVCSTNDMDFVKSLGADTVIDYKKQTLTEYCKANELEFDIILDMVCKITVNQVKSILSTGGTYATTVARLPMLLESTKPSQSKKFIFDVSKSTHEVMDYISEISAMGLYKPLIADVFPLKNIQQAHKRVKQTPKRGAVVVKMK